MTTRIIAYSEEFLHQYCWLYLNIWRDEPYGEEFAVEDIVSGLKNKGDLMFLLLNDSNNIIGFAGGRHLSEYANAAAFTDRLDPDSTMYVDELAICPGYRNSGYARKLINYFMEECLARNKTKFVLKTHSSPNNPAKLLYNSLGFRPFTNSAGEQVTRSVEINRVDDRSRVDVRGYYYKVYPGIEELRGVFTKIAARSYRGVDGVWKFSANKPGPVLGITMCTHGDEPAGLAVLWNFIDQNLQDKLLCGSVIFVLQNIDAAAGYFDDTDSDQRRKFRYTPGGINFNRLPEEALELKDHPAYEIGRLQKLYKIYQEFEYGFDIHTSDDKVPVIIAGGRFYPELVRGFPVETVLTNIESVQINVPSFTFFGGKKSNIPVMEIEAGLHESPVSFKTAIDCSLALMQNLTMLPGKTRKEVSAYKEYYIHDRVVFPNDTFELVKTFSYYEEVTAGQVLAKGIADGGPQEIIAVENGHVIFPPIGKLKRDYFSTSEEVLFISKPVKTITV